jgi:hypothetical protein
MFGDIDREGIEQIRTEESRPKYEDNPEVFNDEDRRDKGDKECAYKKKLN